MRHKWIHTFGAGLVAAAGLSLGLAANARAALIGNGDFETIHGTGTTRFAGYQSTGSPVMGDAPVAIQGDHSPLIAQGTYLDIADNNDVNNKSNLTNAKLQHFVMEFDVATSTTTGDSTKQMEFFIANTDGSRIQFGLYDNKYLRVINSGSGSSTITALTDALTLSPDQNHLKVNHIKLEAVYGANPYYVVTVTDADNQTQTSGHLSYYYQNGGVLTENAYPNRISFSNFTSAAGSWTVVDNFSVTVVPEPAGLGLLSLGGLLLTRKRN